MKGMIMFTLLAYDNNKMPRGIRNNNPLNIRDGRAVKWEGKVGTDIDGFVIFSSPSYGIRAAALLASNYIEMYHLSTIDSIITRWVGGDPEQYTPYIAYIKRNTGYSSMMTIETLTELAMLLYSMHKYENGGEYYTLSYYVEVVKLSLTNKE